jgi:hypothetical protein
MEETIRPLSFGMLLPCLRTQYLLRTNGVVSMSNPNSSFPHTNRVIRDLCVYINISSSCPGFSIYDVAIYYWLCDGTVKSSLQRKLFLYQTPPRLDPRPQNWRAQKIILLTKKPKITSPEQSFTVMALNLRQKQTGISLSGSSSCFRSKTHFVSLVFGSWSPNFIFHFVWFE